MARRRGLVRGGVVAAAVAVALVGVPAQAQAPAFQEYSLTAGSNPAELTVGPDGNIWSPEVFGNKIAEVTPSGAVTEFPFDAGDVARAHGTPYPFGITSAAGLLWISERGVALRTGLFSIRAMTTNGTFRLSVPLVDQPIWLTKGPDGNVWFSEQDTTGHLPGAIGRLTPDGHVKQYALSGRGQPFDLTTGPDGAIWFAELGKIGRVTMHGKLTEFTLPKCPAGGKVPKRGAFYITAGPDGNLWFSDPQPCFPGENLGNTIGRISTSGVFLGDLAIPTPDSFPEGLTSAGGQIWFDEFCGNKVGSVTVNGAFQEFTIPSATPPAFLCTANTSGPQQIISRPTSDGSLDLWFTESATAKIGRLTASG